MARLSGISVLVSGAASALGQATMSRLIAEGAQVIAGEHRQAQVVSDAFGDRVEVIELDVTEPASWARATQHLTSRSNGVHGLVNSAAAVRSGPLADMAAEEIATMIDVNMLGPALGIQAIAPVIAAAGGGSIVNIASTEAFRGTAHAAVFSATNWGLRGLTRSAALELGASGIRVNTVCPSSGLLSVPTERSDESAPLRDGADVRAATMGDVAAMVAFLLSDDSSTCTGGDFRVDAGTGL